MDCLVERLKQPFVGNDFQSFIPANKLLDLQYLQESQDRLRKVSFLTECIGVSHQKQSA